MKSNLHGKILVHDLPIQNDSGVIVEYAETASALQVVGILSGLVPFHLIVLVSVGLRQA